MANACAIIKADKKMIQTSFIKCDPSNSLDDNENNLGNIKSLDGYNMPKSERECYVLRSEDESKSES